MKAIMVMFDSLRRDLLSCYGGPVRTPNFDRLAGRAAVFDRFYAGSLPCMPARREIHTGRYNMLHRSWGPMEPFDDSMPQILRQHGIYTHLATDHYHYVEDGGCTYHSRYSSWVCGRGQAHDAYVADLAPHPDELAPNQFSGENLIGKMREMRMAGGWCNMHNREIIRSEEDFPMHRTFDNGLDFLSRNGRFDNWFLTIETFDPHEPFTSPEAFNSRYFSSDEADFPDWPPYSPVKESPDMVDKMRKKYFALTEFCDAQLGRVLDKMDEMDLWKDTMLIVNTDHGFFLSEHDWWGKGFSPNYEELVHIPLFIWDPRCPEAAGQRRRALAQTIDLAPTLLEYFGVEIPEDMQGKPLRGAVCHDTPLRDYALFGYHGSPISVTDGDWVLMRAVQDMDEPFYEYTQMPTHMRSLFSPEEMRTAEMAPPFSFTKGCPVMRIRGKANPRFAAAQDEGQDLLFDLTADPGQNRPLTDERQKARLLSAMARLFRESDAPEEAYRRYDLPFAE